MVDTAVAVVPETLLDTTAPAVDGGEPAVARVLAEGTTRQDVAARSVALDGVRAVAALMVLGMHANGLVPDVDAGGAIHFLRYHLWTGVDLFFALSGFLIAGPFLRALATGRELPETAAYAVRRAARILPAYWVALSVLLISLPPDGTTGGSVLSHYGLAHDWLPGQSRDLYPVAWTLGIEACFYLLVPLAALWVRSRVPGPIPARRLCQGILVLAAISGLWGVVWGWGFDHVALLRDHSSAHTIISDNVPAALVLFCPGMLLAVLTMRPAGTPSSRAFGERLGELWTLPSSVVLVAAAGVFVAGIGIGGYHGRVAPALRDALFLPLAAGLTLFVFVRSGRWIARFARILAPFGVISYGIYLWQWAALEWLQNKGVSITLHHGRVIDFVVAYCVLAAVTLPLALGSWLAVERPALRWAASWARTRVALIRAMRSAEA